MPHLHDLLGRLGFVLGQRVSFVDPSTAVDHLPPDVPPTPPAPTPSPDATPPVADPPDFPGEHAPVADPPMPTAAP